MWGWLLVTSLVGCFFGWLVGGCLIVGGWLHVWLIGGCLTVGGWFHGWLVGWLVLLFGCCIG